MNLSEFIKQYRKEHDMSLRAFASFVGMSTQQISNIEKGIGNNGKPMKSNIVTYHKIANAIGVSELDFFTMLNDDMIVNPSDETIKNLPTIEIDGHLLLDLSALNKSQKHAIIDALGADQFAVSAALRDAESSLSSQQVQDDQ